MATNFDSGTVRLVRPRDAELSKEDIPHNDAQSPTTHTRSRTSVHEGGRALGVARSAENPIHPATSESDVNLYFMGGGTRTDSMIEIADGEQFETEQFVLSQELRAAMIDGPSGRYLPIDKLESIVTTERVTTFLSIMFSSATSTVRLDTAEYTFQICNTAKDSPQRRGIFAILTLLYQSKDILQFIKAGVHDGHLPFALEPNRCALGLKKGHLVIQKWNPLIYESFVDTYQWNVLVPIFKFAVKPGDEYQHYSLDPKQVLPQREVKESKPAQRGGSAEVRCVQFHEAHHNLASLTAGSVYVSLAY